MNLYELVKAETIKSIYESDTNIKPYEGEIFFPYTRQKGLKFEFVKGKQGTPVALVSSSLNANVLYRDRISFEVLSGKLPFFKEAYKIDEELRQELLSTKEEYTQQLVNKLFDDEMQLLQGADVTTERMRMQLLSTGTISIVENGVNKQYDYGFNNATQFKTVSTLWSASGADPLKNLMEEIKNYKTITKKNAKYCIIDETTFDKLSSSEGVLNYFSNLSQPNAYPTFEEIKNFLESRTSLTFIILDKVYLEARDFNGTPKKFYPEDRFTLVSTADLGQTIYGTTPEEADLLGQQSKASSVALTNKGVAITTWNEVDPVNVNTKVSEVVIPTCPNIDQIYIVKVL